MKNYILAEPIHNFHNVLADNFKLSNERIYDLNERSAHLKDQTSSDFPVDFISLYSYPSPPTHHHPPHTLPSSIVHKYHPSFPPISPSVNASKYILKPV